MSTTENGSKLNDFVGIKIQNNELSNDDLVELIKLCGDYLNLKTIPDYAKAEKISYPGVLKRKNIEIVKIFNTKYVIDNE